MSGPSDPRVTAAERVLAEHGIPGARVEVLGHQDEIAAIRIPGADWMLALGDAGERLAGEVRQLGFRYVAVDLLAADESPFTEG